MPGGMTPAELFRDRILCCFIEDRIGVRLLDEFNIDNVCWESDYPHSDSSWPNAPEHLEVLFADLDDATINKITHENAMRHYKFDPFAVRSARAVHGGGVACGGHRRRHRRRAWAGSPTSATSRRGRTSPAPPRACAPDQEVGRFVGRREHEVVPAREVVRLPARGDGP